MGKDYGRVYRVQIKFNEKIFETGEKFIEKVIPGVLEDEESLKLESVEGNLITILWTVPDREGVHEIENELFYVLEDGKYGNYTCEFVD